MFDDKSKVTVTMLNDQMHLQNADSTQLRAGRNVAALASEIIQFGSVKFIGNNHYELSHLVRGVGGREIAVQGHSAGDDFVVVERQSLQPIDRNRTDIGQTMRVFAQGIADDVVVAKDIVVVGRAIRPWSPCQGKAQVLTDGSIQCS